MSRRTELQVTVANKSSVIGPTGFKGYDLMANPYVGCQFGCRYCYVRFFVTDPDAEWGDFVRVRMHVQDKLPKELSRGYFRMPDGKRIRMEDGEPVLKDGKQVRETLYRNLPQEQARLVIGTMTDPYQPVERQHRITRAMLKALLAASPQLNKVGIFTRSPYVLDDLDLIVQLPRKRVHFTVTPYTPEVLRLIEPIAIQTERRFDTITKLKAAGVRMHCNVAPAIPIISEQFTTQYAERLASIGVDEFFVDPMQAYSESFDALKESMKDHENWERIEEIMQDKQAYLDWKEVYKQSWLAAWAKVRSKSPHTLPIWSDHITHTWTNMNTGEDMDVHRYGDDLE